MVMKQERTGKLKWLKELRETEWHPYVKRLLVEGSNRIAMRLNEPITVTEVVYASLDADLELVKIVHEELARFCDSAKVMYDRKHAYEGLYLVWDYKTCDNPNCGTCFNKLRLHYPYPYIYRGARRVKGISVRRAMLAPFLTNECGFVPDQANIVFDLTDLRHLLIRHYHYNVLKFRNLGFKVRLGYKIP